MACHLFSSSKRCSVHRPVWLPRPVPWDSFTWRAARGPFADPRLLLRDLWGLFGAPLGIPGFPFRCLWGLFGESLGILGVLWGAFGGSVRNEVLGQTARNFRTSLTLRGANSFLRFAAGATACGPQLKKHTHQRKDSMGMNPNKHPPAKGYKGQELPIFVWAPRGGPSHGNPSALPVRPVRPRMKHKHKYKKLTTHQLLSNLRTLQRIRNCRVLKTHSFSHI